MTRVRLAVEGLVLALLLAVIGVVLNSTSERSIKARLAQDLHTLLKADVTALLLWLDDREDFTEYFAQRTRVRAAARRLSDLNRQGGSFDQLRTASGAQVLADMFDPVLARFRYNSYYLIDDRNEVVASSLDESLGQRVGAPIQKYVSRMLAGETVVTHAVHVAGDTTEVSAAMYIGAPVRDEDGRILGVLAFAIPPDDGFTDILRVARMGVTGESYAFDSTGLMISESRFEDELRSIGLLPPGADVSSVLRIQIRDPGRDLRQGDGSQVSQHEFPLTRMAADAINRPYDATREDLGIVTDVSGYNDYRGVPVIGAWVWLPEYGVGVTTEVDVEEAFALQPIIRNVFSVIFGLLVVSALVLLLSSLWIGRLQVRLLRNVELEREIAARKAAEVELKTLSQRMITAQDDDRARIGRDLHDDIAQRLYAAAIRFDPALRAVTTDPKNATECLKSIQKELDGVAEDTRKISHDLHPATLEIVGLTSCMKGLGEDFEALTGVTTRVAVPEAVQMQASQQVALSLYRIMQEGLSNVAKYAKARSVVVEMCAVRGHIRLRICDDGTGFDQQADTAGLGLASMRERARLLDGMFTIESAPGAGTALLIELPVQRAHP